MKIQTSVKAGKPGLVNHNETAASVAALKVRTSIKAGATSAGGPIKH